MRNYRNIDMEKYPRIDHFRYFSGFAIPYGGVTADVDITEFMKTLRERTAFLSVVFLLRHKGSQRRSRAETENYGGKQR